jgi:hypothetical protein
MPQLLTFDLSLPPERTRSVQAGLTYQQILILANQKAMFIAQKSYLCTPKKNGV